MPEVVEKIVLGLARDAMVRPIYSNPHPYILNFGMSTKMSVPHFVLQPQLSLKREE